ncbi:MAG: RdgB/HAM1 family non-canonical purine NTP pyrophosphatase [Candidatus Omnitrophica bacterium]|nr:RdgB/HAM1 family non-canonical purine NTP pyrophosphatase [Candidatus Omnitrophota bacterium]
MNPWIVLCSANQDKLKELRRLMKGLGVRVVSVADLDRPLPKVVENGRTFAENAAKKARIYSRLSDHLTIADDSGLCVRALNGRPGVYSARFAGPGCTYDDNNRKLLSLLEGKPLKSRGATFISTIAVYQKGRKIKIIKGAVDGTITEKAMGRHGFGFDPVFVPKGSRVTFAQMSSAAKNKTSHRGLALREVRKFLESYFKKTAGKHRP